MRETVCDPVPPIAGAPALRFLEEMEPLKARRELVIIGSSKDGRVYWNIIHSSRFFKRQPCRVA